MRAREPDSRDVKLVLFRHVECTALQSWLDAKAQPALVLLPQTLPSTLAQSSVSVAEAVTERGAAYQWVISGDLRTQRRRARTADGHGVVSLRLGATPPEVLIRGEPNGIAEWCGGLSASAYSASACCLTDLKSAPPDDGAHSWRLS